VARFLLLVCALAACSTRKHEEPPPAPPKGGAEVDARCTPLPFAPSSPVPEASGAAWLTIDGKPALVVVGDSGRHGAYAVLDPETGETREEGTLPLGDAGDDLEGLAGRGDRLYGLTSSGWLRAWTRAGKGFTLVDGPTPIGPVTLSDKQGPPEGTGMVCGAKATNCGRDYEGLCLVDPAHAKGPCAGFAAARADGHLYCLEERDGRFVATHELRVPITRPGALADCAFADDGTLWAGANLLGLAQVWRIDGWDAPATATVTPFMQLGAGFPEVLAVRGDVFYRMSDLGGAPSLLAKYRCTR
jgi:hypothetical protein